MSAAWVAGGVRARGLAHRRIGPEAARRVAAAGSLEEALRLLAATPYGREVHPGQTLAQAQHAVAAAVLWYLRVLAGWLPQGGAHLLRTLAAWFEIANLDELLHTMSTGEPGDVFTLGSLATAWTRLREAGSEAELRARLAASAWGDMGADDVFAVRFGLRARWGLRAADLRDPVRTWATAATALLVAGQRFASGQAIPAAMLPSLRGVMGAAAEAGTLDMLAAALPARARWVLADVRSPGGLWRAEAAWWARVEQDAFSLLRTSANDSTPVIGATAVLAADAWRVRAALAIAAGGGPLEAYDAVA